MNIGETSQLTDLPAKTIRYYEEIGLVTPARDSNGYRQFRATDVHKLNFLGRARALGFSIEDCRMLLALYEDETRSSADVKALASKQLAAIEEKIRDLNAMHETLTHLVDACAGDDRPDCPILKGLTSNPV